MIRFSFFKSVEGSSCIFLRPKASLFLSCESIWKSCDFNMGVLGIRKSPPGKSARTYKIIGYAINYLGMKIWKEGIAGLSEVTLMTFLNND